MLLDFAGTAETYAAGMALAFAPTPHVRTELLTSEAFSDDWVNAGAIVPIVSPEASTGWLAIAHSEAGKFDAGTLEFLTHAASLCETHLDGQVRSTELTTLSEQLHRSERELHVAKAQLEISNQELEQFAYIAAHELVAPLRSVAVFAEVLATMVEQDAESKPELSNCVVEIRSGVQTMTEQVQYLLSLSKANQHMGELELVDTTRVAHDAADTTVAPLDEVGGSIDIEQLPMVRAHAVPLQSVFANLITNATRYRHPDRPVNIKVTGTTEEDNVVIHVADNARGISDEARERIFGLFERNSTDKDGLAPAFRWAG